MCLETISCVQPKKEKASSSCWAALLQVLHQNWHQPGIQRRVALFCCDVDGSVLHVWRAGPWQGRSARGAFTVHYGNCSIQCFYSFTHISNQQSGFVLCCISYDYYLLCLLWVPGFNEKLNNKSLEHLITQGSAGVMQLNLLWRIHSTRLLSFYDFNLKIKLGKNYTSVWCVCIVQPPGDQNAPLMEEGYFSDVRDSLKGSLSVFIPCICHRRTRRCREPRALAKSVGKHWSLTPCKDSDMVIERGTPRGGGGGWWLLWMETFPEGVSARGLHVSQPVRHADTNVSN